MCFPVLYSSISVGSSHTLASLLAENCAYYKGNTPILLSELEGQKTLDGTVTVQECQHKDVTPTANNDGTHTLSCPYCGYTKAAENCDYGEYTHNDTSHTRICKLCGYQNVEAHKIKCTAEASGTVIAVSEACKTCGYAGRIRPGAETVEIRPPVRGQGGQDGLDRGRQGRPIVCQGGKAPDRVPRAGNLYDEINEIYGY